jgi:division/cell wall cluster transcriptional repressor MraZ
MAAGGLLCLFCLGLFWMWRDGNRLVAQNTPPAAKSDVPPPVAGIFDLPDPVPPPKPKPSPKEKVPPPDSGKKASLSDPLPPPLSGDLPPPPPLPADHKKDSAPPAKPAPRMSADKLFPDIPPPADKVGPPPLPPPASGLGSAHEPPPKSVGPPPVSPASLLDAKPPETAPLRADLTPPTPPKADLPGKKAATELLPEEPPLAPPPGPVQTYKVRGNETMRDIAQRTLGSAERWSDIHKLNPMLKPDLVLASGTVVQLPGEACIVDDPEPLKPLPVMHPKAGPAKPRAVLPLTGTYPANLDDKKAMTLPAGIREQLGSAETLLVSPGSDQCLWLTNQAQLERLAHRLENCPAHETEVRVFKRLYFAQTEKAPLNSEGRIRIPERLAQFAGLHQEVILVGIDDHFEVWDAAHWREYTQQKSGGRAGD